MQGTWTPKTPKNEVPRPVKKCSRFVVLFEARLHGRVVSGVVREVWGKVHEGVPPTIDHIAHASAAGFHKVPPGSGSL